MDINFKNGSSIEVSEDMGKLVAISTYPTADDIEKMLKFFGIDSNRMVKCPECDMYCRIRYMMPHLNDSFGKTYSSTYKLDNEIVTPPDISSFENHGMSFKQIGKWLESLGY